MKKGKKITRIIFLIVFIIIALNIYVYESALSNMFSSEYLSEEEIIDTVTQNIGLLNEAPNEIKSIDNSSFYIDIAKKVQVNYISIKKFPFYNRVNLYVINNDLKSNNPAKVIKSETLSKILKIKGINAIERYYSKSGRMCILFDCGSSSIFYYFGFYYTADNQPIGWKGQDVSFNQYKNRWIWNDPQYSARIYITERITDNWFYFRMSEFYP